MQRRAWLLGAAGGLAGCGFALRRAPGLRFHSLALAGFAPRSPLAAELRRQLAASAGTRLLDDPAQAEVVLEALVDRQDKGVAASTAAGQVRELQLRVRLHFRLRTPAGRELIPLTELALSRDLSYTESAALAKEQEEAALYRAMQSDIAAQVMRRLAALPAL